MEHGDVIVLSAGIYHRFTLDERNVIETIHLLEVRRAAVAPYNRGESTNAYPIRHHYLRTIGVGASTIGKEDVAVWKKLRFARLSLASQGFSLFPR
ncbi:hypothetical protein NEOLEDRAFT_1228893 [Neolentinus lepideus HHB14362 ss-1]|uniref:Acireductone dioxygenase (Fe(2+)-requiring) n=1 Tax=Neolentinus lepideus HHB14362 ss-1 TaxID=1314782 RepID=A0A165P305_9AGAM|nr:hypothetical protein NEOLEDRAFT_1228893 [Neolentinus lepideus HHB14362 ss-1]